MTAQRQRLDIISGNMANQFTTHDVNGKYAPYRRRVPVFATGDGHGSDKGVHIANVELDASPFRKVWDPGNAHADKNGYVDMPNIEPTIEMVNAMEASRAYEANIMAAEATKSMISSAIRLLA
jgi:flagellar basal-body rod protein FlgC